MGLLLCTILGVMARHGAADRGGFVEEAIPFRQALTLWGWGDRPATANPHFFSYPSFSIYMHWISQAAAVLVGMIGGKFLRFEDAGVEFVLDPTYLVSAARAMISATTALLALLVYGWWRSRDRLLGAAAAIAICVCPLMIRAILGMPPEALMGPALVLLVWTSACPSQPSRRRLIVIGVLAGILLGTKLSALPTCLLCIGWACRPVLGLGSRVRAIVGAALVAVVSFALTTPFSLLDFESFRRGVQFEWGHLQTGHLLGSPSASSAAHLSQIWHSLGVALPIAILLLPRVWRRLPGGAALALISALTFLIPATLSSAGGPERYVVPAVPMLWLFVAEVVFALRGIAQRLERVAWMALATAGVAQILTTAAPTALDPVEAPSARASRWLRQHASTSDIIVVERGAVALRTLDDARDLRRSRCFAGASRAWQDAAMSASWYSVVTLPFVASGVVSTTVGEKNGAATHVVVFDPSWDLVPAVYEALEAVGIQYLARTGVVANRLGALFPELSLDRAPGAWTAVSRQPFMSSASGVRQDPAVVVFGPGSARLAPRVLRGDWWRSRAHLEFAGPAVVALSAMDSARIAISATRQVFDQWFEPYLMRLAELSLTRGDQASALSMARLVLLNQPESILAIRIALLGLAQQGQSGIPGRDPATTLRQGSDEPLAAWLSRALSEWGVAGSAASEEVARFVEWRRLQTERAQSSDS